jgi:hypothetical protein
MSRVFLVKTKSHEYLFSEKNFYDFVNRNSSRGWSFSYGEIDSNTPLKSSKSIKVNELKKELNINKIRPLLTYKILRFGTQYIYDIPHFSQEVYFKYGERSDRNPNKSTKK